MEDAEYVTQECGKPDTTESNHKRKRKRETGDKHKLADISPLNGSAEVGERDILTKDHPPIENASSFNFGSALMAPPVKLRSNPFSISTINQAASGSEENAESKYTRPATPPLRSLSSPLSSKKVIELENGEMSDDDPDYSPPVKRKDSGRFPASPRNSQKVKEVIASTKKLATKEHLKERSRELLEERSKLPIWTGILFLYSAY